jgi:hypothetical protein
MTVKNSTNIPQIYKKHTYLYTPYWIIRNNQSAHSTDYVFKCTDRTIGTVGAMGTSFLTPVNHALCRRLD